MSDVASGRPASSVVVLRAPMSAHVVERAVQAGDTVSHEPLPAVVQLPPVHPAGTPVTLTPADPLSDVGLADVGLIEKLVHVGDEVPLCVTEKLWPAIVALPERDDADVF